LANPVLVVAGCNSDQGIIKRPPVAERKMGRCPAESALDSKLCQAWG
jgi:hypothetical protein